MHSVRFIALWASGMALCSAAQVFAFSWTATELSALNGSQVHITDLNDAGQIVGSVSTGGAGARAFLYSHGVRRDLGTLGGGSSGAYGINSAGQIVGWAETGAVDEFGSPIRSPFLYAEGSMRSLGDWGAANGINDAGDVVGGRYQGILYQNGNARPLPGDCGVYCYATKINNAGQVIGQYAAELRDHDAYFYSDGVKHRIPGLDLYSQANDLNDAGQVVGKAFNRGVDVADKAFVYYNGVTRELSGLGQSSRSANSINNAGLIVGDYRLDEFSSHAFLYRDDTMVDMNALDLDYAAIFDGDDFFAKGLQINNANQILVRDNNGRVFLISQVPEPETYALLVGGLGVMSLVARRRKSG